VKKLTSPRRKTVLGTEGNNFMGAIVSEKQSGVIGKGLVSYPRSGLFPVLFRARMGLVSSGRFNHSFGWGLWELPTVYW